MQIEGNVFVVTGAGNGIGRAVTRALVAGGGIVAGADLSTDGLAATAQLVADRSRFSSHVLDIADSEAVAAFPAEVIAAHGHVDGLFNIAGIPQPSSTIADIDDARIDSIMRINLFGTIWMTRAFLPHLSERPAAVIMNTSSLSAIAPFPGAAIYGASKAAVELFGAGLAQDLRGSSSTVTVTTALPGTVWTDLVRETSRAMGAPEAVAKAFALAPDTAARRMITATLAGRTRVVIGADAHVFDVVARVSTRLADQLSYLQVGRMVYRTPRDSQP